MPNSVLSMTGGYRTIVGGHVPSKTEQGSSRASQAAVGDSTTLESCAGANRAAPILTLITVSDHPESREGIR